MRTMVRTERPRRRLSVKWQLLALIILVEIPFCGLFLYGIGQTADRIDAQLAKTQSSALNTFCTSIQNEVTDADQFLFVDCWSDDAFRRAAAADTAEREALLRPALDTARMLLDNSKSLGAVVFCRPDADWYKALDSEANRQNTALDVARTVTQTQTQSANGGWFCCETNGTPYLVRLCGWQGLYAMVIMDLADITISAQVDYSMSAAVVFARGDTFLTNALWTRDYSLQEREKAKQKGYYFIDTGRQRYIATEQKFLTLTAIYADIYQADLGWLYGMGILLVGVMLGTFGLALWYLWQAFLHPLNGLVDVMQRISGGDTSLRAPVGASREFSTISASFNTMLERLQQLKISSYESQLQARRAEMDALRLQIRRHFFLNCLKNIYALASEGDTENVKQATLLLSTNLRYTLNFRRDSTDLSTELRMCSDYIRLQGIGQEQKPALAIAMDAGLEGFQVPPVSVLTMLENSCKYGTRQDRALRVSVTARRRHLDAENFVSIVIQDNGLGFPPGMLDILNNDMEKVQAEGHVGFGNTILRLKMLYGPDCAALLTNNNGARIEWIIPVDAKDRPRDHAEET